jgi:enamine deaminase RidA (YjgF/YER057c/UK114 family)
MKKLFNLFGKMDKPTKKILTSSKHPKIELPYSPAVQVNITRENSLIYCSGVLGVNEKGDLVSSDVGEQTKQVMENIKSLLE